MGFQSPLSFKTVIELNISDGALIKFTDFFEIMKKYRKRNLSDGKHGPTENLQEWIARTFSLDYDFYFLILSSFLDRSISGIKFPF